MPVPSQGPGGGRRRLPPPPSPRIPDLIRGRFSGRLGARLEARLDGRFDEHLEADPDTDPEADPEIDAVLRSSAAAAEIVRWGVFSCALVPIVLLVCGSSAGSALGTAVGLAAVTAACRALLRQSERSHAQRTYARFTPDRPGPHRGRHSRTGTGLHRGGRYPGQP